MKPEHPQNPKPLYFIPRSPPQTYLQNPTFNPPIPKPLRFIPQLLPCTQNGISCSSHKGSEQTKFQLRIRLPSLPQLPSTSRCSVGPVGENKNGLLCVSCQGLVDFSPGQLLGTAAPPTPPTQAHNHGRPPTMAITLHPATGVTLHPTTGTIPMPHSTLKLCVSHTHTLYRSHMHGRWARSQ
jgi:hypothetical protein